MNRWARFLALAFACLALCGCLSPEEYWTFGLSRSFEEHVRGSSSLLYPVAEVGTLFLVVIDCAMLPVAIVHDVVLALLGKSLWASLETSLRDPGSDAEPSRKIPHPCRNT